MITVKALMEIDASLAFIKGESFDGEVVSIGHHHKVDSAYLYFVKSKKFLERVANAFDGKTLKNLGLVVDKKFYANSAQDFKTFYDKFDYILEASNVDVSMSKISKPFYDEKYKNMNSQVDGRQLGNVDIHPTARISQNVFIGENVTIGANVTIHPHVTILSNTSIGEGTTIYPNVSIYHDVKIGQNCRFHSNVTIGADGFGYNFHEYIHHKVWHFGGVIIDDDVEIGANSTVDAGAFIPTRVGAGSKIDNLCTVAHNCQLGKGVILAGTAGCAGSSELGDFCFVGGAAKIAPDVSLGAGTMVGASSMVTTNWPAGSKISGFPAREHKDWLREQAYIKKLSKQKS